MPENTEETSNSTQEEVKQPVKVVNKEYLYTQFQRYYDQVCRPDIESLEAQLVKVTRKLNKIVTVCAANNITIDFSDIDNDEN